MPEKQKEAVHYLVKVPLVYTRVGIRNWTSFQELGMSGASSPGMYHTGVNLNSGPDMGSYKSSKTPEEPIILAMTRTPCKPGLPVREQHKAGRAELLSTSFETCERKIRDQLARILSGGGFDPAADIEAITVNRWPHGYGYEYNPLFDPDGRPAKRRTRSVENVSEGSPSPIQIPRRLRIPRCHQSSISGGDGLLA